MDKVSGGFLPFPGQRLLVLVQNPIVNNFENHRCLNKNLKRKPKDSYSEMSKSRRATARPGSITSDEVYP